MIPIDECKDGYLYKIEARNAGVGIYNTMKKAFLIRRVKFGQEMLDYEYHYAADPKYGTAEPINEIEKAIIGTDKEMLQYLKDKL